MVSRLHTATALHFRNLKKWCPLPEWAQFYIQTGWDLLQPPTAGSRTLCGLSVPHRGFASGFAALGAILAEDIPQPASLDVVQHFKTLLALPHPAQKETRLVYVRDGRRMRGQFAGVENLGDAPCVKICVQAKAAHGSGGLTHFVREADAVNVQFDMSDQPHLSRHASGRALVRSDPFVEHFYSPEELHLIQLAAPCRVLLIGRVNALRQETTATALAIRGDNQYSQGKLNDLLRIRKFVTEGTTARVAVHSTMREGRPDRSEDRGMNLVIFDGADAFAKWATSFPHSNLLAILDRTEPQFLEGLNQMRARLYSPSSTEVPAGHNRQVPPGIEALWFREATR